MCLTSFLTAALVAVSGCAAGLTRMGDFNLATHQSAILKDLGNKLLGEGKPEEAMAKYSEAISAFEREGLKEGMAVCLVNRSIVNGKLARWPESYCDAKLACSLFPRFFKAWYRCGVALCQFDVEVGTVLCDGQDVTLERGAPVALSHPVPDGSNLPIRLVAKVRIIPCHFGKMAHRTVG